MLALARRSSFSFLALPLGLLALPLWLAAADARADLIDPAEEACGEAGKACTVDGQSGTCVAETCSRLDYSNPDPGGGPGTREYECVRCKLGVKPPEAAPASKEAAPASKEGPPASKGSACAVDPTGTSLLSLGLGLGLLGLVTRRSR